MQIIGHRGARGEAPENTLGGFQYLKKLGISAVEFDVRQLRQGQLVVIHDDNFLRTSGVSQYIYDDKPLNLSLYDHRKNWNDWHQPEPTPTLEQVMDVVQNFQHTEVEIKAVATDVEAEKITHAISDILENHQEHVTITSFDEKILKALQKQNSKFKRGLLVESRTKKNVVEKAQKLGCKRIGWMDQLATPEAIQLSHQAQIEVSVWTVNQIDRAKQLRDQGVQGLITDYPKLMLQHL